MPLRWGQNGSNEEVAAKWCPPDDGLPNKGWYIDGVGETGRRNAVDVFASSSIMCKLFFQKSRARTPESVASPPGCREVESTFSVTHGKNDGFMTPQPNKERRYFTPVHSFKTGVNTCSTDKVCHARGCGAAACKQNIKTKNRFEGLTKYNDETELSSSSEQESYCYNSNSEYYNDLDPFVEFGSGKMNWADEVDKFGHTKSNKCSTTTRVVQSKVGDVTTTQVSCTIITHSDGRN